jgi:DNA-directed RNA polymerase subunit RPC12/RpoP
MQLTFSCPSCGKEYDLSWSMAGKKARCKQCSHEFVIPAPFEPTAPRSSEAIPVTETPDSPRPSPVARTVRLEVPTLETPSSTNHESEDPPWPHHVKARWKEPALAGSTLAPKASKSPNLSLEPSARPAWLISAIVVGGVSLLLVINIGFYLALFGGR